MPVPQRFSLVTLGVSDVSRATAFYRALGWRESSASMAGDISFFATPGGVLALWRRDHLAADAGVTAEPDAQPGPGASPVASHFRGVAVAINLASVTEVDEVVATWVAAGGSISKAPTTAEWGGYSGYVADPDGNLWEIAHNPSWPLDDRGLPVIPGASGT